MILNKNFLKCLNINSFLLRILSYLLILITHTNRWLLQNFLSSADVSCMCKKILSIIIFCKISKQGKVSFLVIILFRTKKGLVLLNSQSILVNCLLPMKKTNWINRGISTNFHWSNNQRNIRNYPQDYSSLHYMYCNNVILRTLNIYCNFSEQYFLSVELQYWKTINLFEIN